MEGLSGEGDVDESGDLALDDNMDDLDNDPAFKPIQAGSLTALDIFYEVTNICMMTNVFRSRSLLIPCMFCLFVCLIDGTTWIEKYWFSGN